MRVQDICPVTVTQTLNTPGNIGTVEVLGTINATTGAGIQATADRVTVTNAAKVTAPSDGGGSGSGIVVKSYCAITNSSSGTVTAGNGAGISAKSNNTITNAGLISGHVGIGAVGDSNTISSSGMVTSGRDRGREDGWVGHGIQVRGDGTTITNSGTVTGASSGIVARGGTKPSPTRGQRRVAARGTASSPTAFTTRSPTREPPDRLPAKATASTSTATTPSSTREPQKVTVAFLLVATPRSPTRETCWA